MSEAATATLNEGQVEELVGKVLGDLAGTFSVVLAGIGDKLGLFRQLAEGGPATSTELAERSGIDARYAREWLGAMVTAGYVDYEPETERISLPPEHIGVFAQEGGPHFFGGAIQEGLGALGVLDQIVEAFRSGGGVPQSAYPQDFYEGLERFTAGWFENLLLPVWIPAVPEVESALRKGARVADVGCGAGRAVIKLAEAFPSSTFVGYDVHAPSVERARTAASEAGVADRCSFEVSDVAEGIDGPFDLITTFDVVHDAVDPTGLLRGIHAGLAPDGTYLCLDINCSDRLEENVGPLGALFHGFSVLYCMTTSLAQGGAGLGTVGLHEPKLRELAAKAGFSSVRRLPLENPFNNLYELKP